METNSKRRRGRPRVAVHKPQPLVISFSNLSKSDLERLDARAKRNIRNRSQELIAILHRALRSEKSLTKQEHFTFTEKAEQLLRNLK